MIIKEMFYIPIKHKPEHARASMTTSEINGFPSKDAFSCNRVAIPRTELSVQTLKWKITKMMRAQSILTGKY
jgi:hypothetical protein